MPETNKEQLSPEEKLLKVIQTGGQLEPQPSPEEKLAKAVGVPVAQEPVPAASRVIPAAPPVQAGPAVSPGVPAAPPSKPVPAAAPVVPAAPPVQAGPVASPLKPVPASPEAKPTIANKPPLVVKSAKSEVPKLKLNRPPGQEQERAAKAAALAKAMGAPAAGAGPDGGVAGPPISADASTAPAPAPGSGAPVARGALRRTAPAGRAVPRTKFGERPAMLTLANRSLAAVILLTVGLCGYEIWAAIQWGVNFGSITKGPGSTEVPALPGLDIPAETYLLQDVLDRYAKRPLLGTFEAPPRAAATTPTTTTTAPVVQVAATDVEAYARDNLQMIGHSMGSDGRMEAIVMDKLDKRMHVLVVGHMIPVKDRIMTVKEILSDRVIVNDGAVSVVIK